MCSTIPLPILLVPVNGSSPTECRAHSRHAVWHRAGDVNQIFITNGSRIFTVDDEVINRLDAAMMLGDHAVEQELMLLGLFLPPLINDIPVSSPPLRAISLAVAQKCNLGCTYCYASQGDFGGPAKNMSSLTARRAIDLLIASAEPGGVVNVAFLGGEPLMNRVVLQDATDYATKVAAARNVRVGFSLTTNGTLLNEADAEFFEQNGFAVTVSLDGLRDDHDRQRPFKNGTGTFDRIMERVQPLLTMQRRMQVSVRATILPGNVELRETVDFFLAKGFHSVGFSPVLRSPTGSGELSQTDLAGLLAAMIDCGLEFERQLLLGKRYAFVNVLNALREIHRGTHRPYPCGAGAGYLGVSADGDVAACHRFVADENGQMGNLSQGIDRGRQNDWLARRHVHQQSPCGACWARYLCSGGCHHEVLARGRKACDFIRGWLNYCLQAYARLSRLQPEWFAEISANSTESKV